MGQCRRVRQCGGLAQDSWRYVETRKKSNDLKQQTDVVSGDGVRAGSTKMVEERKYLIHKVHYANRWRQIEQYHVQSRNIRLEYHPLH